VDVWTSYTIFRLPKCNVGIDIHANANASD
jgi:hypothetical protein